MIWEVIDTGTEAARRIMERDAQLLDALDSVETPILHLYDWQGDSATYGHFIDPYAYLSREGVARCHLSLAKRPTGGGITFHLCDLAFSVLVPACHHAYSSNTLQNYAFVNAMVLEAVERFLGESQKLQLLPQEDSPYDEACCHFCMAKPTKYDVMLQGRKVGGAAQRRTKKGFLHQGTIALGRLQDDYLEAALLPGTRVAEAMRDNSYPLLGDSWTSAQLAEARQDMRHLLQVCCLQHETVLS